MQMKKIKKKNRKQYSSIDHHKRNGSKLIAPLNTLPMTALKWMEDFLPEHLWIESLYHLYPKYEYIDLYSAFLDELEKYCAAGTVLYGYISDFDQIPVDKRAEFVRDNENLILEAFYKPFGRMIAFYSESPCGWLIKSHLEKDEPLNPEVELSKLSECVMRLLPGKDLYAGHIRVLPLNREFKHDKLKIMKGVASDVIDLIPKYPTGCTEKEQYRVQQFARMQMNARHMMSDYYKQSGWCKYFWRHNYDIVPCKPVYMEFKGEGIITDNTIKELHKHIEFNIESAIAYLGDVAEKFRYDIYDSTRDEILLGLFSRITRLYVLICGDQYFWSRDIAGIMLRCMTDTVITFAYLAIKGSVDDFKAFRAYGEGKEKLLMLHLQDHYAGRKTVEGRELKDIAEELGSSLNPDMVDIELSNWTKKTTRDMALEVGLGEIYSLVYDPTSSDVHGTWISLKNSNLVHCGQPLHKYHRIPHFFEPPLYVNTIDAVLRIYLASVDIAIGKLNFPVMSVKMESAERLLKKGDVSGIKGDST